MRANSRIKPTSLIGFGSIAMLMVATRGFADPPTQTAPPASASASPVTPSALDSDSLNPAFRYDDSAITEALGKGKGFYEGSKDINEALAHWMTDVTTGHGKKKDSVGKALCLSINAGDFALEGYEAAHLCEEPVVPDTVRTLHFHDSAEFEIRLLHEGSANEPTWKNLSVITPHAASTVGNGPNTDAVGRSMPDDIHVIKVLLVDDMGHSYPVSFQLADTHSGSYTYSGTNSNSAYIPGNPGHDSTVTVLPPGQLATFETVHTDATPGKYVSVDTPYQATSSLVRAYYTAHLPLFDKDGKPLIAKGVKKITLRIITVTGEDDAEFAL